MATAGRRGNNEGSAPYQRKDGRWQVLIRYTEGGVAKRTAVTAKTQAEVRRKVQEVRRRLEAKQPPRDRKATLGEFAEEWIRSTLAVSDRKQTTRSLYASLARKHIIGNDLGSVTLDRLTPRRIEAWVGSMRDAGLAESTIRSCYTVLRDVLATAQRDRAIATNPAAGPASEGCCREVPISHPSRCGRLSRPRRASDTIRCSSSWSTPASGAAKRWR